MHTASGHFLPFPFLLMGQTNLNGQTNTGARQGKTPVSAGGKIATLIIWGEEQELMGVDNS